MQVLHLSQIHAANLHRILVKFFRKTHFLSYDSANVSSQQCRMQFQNRQVRVEDQIRSQQAKLSRQ